MGRWYRANKICDVEFIEHEVAYLEEVFSKHGYSFNFVNKAHQKARKSYYGIKEKEPFLKDDECLLVMPQTGHENKFVSTYLKNCKVVGVYKNMLTVKKALARYDKSSSNKPCIYKLPCRMCDKVYIGESIDFERRKREHRDAIKRGDENNAVFKHM